MQALAFVGIRNADGTIHPHPAGPGHHGRRRQGECDARVTGREMPADNRPGDFESALKPLWLRAQPGDDLAYRQALGMIASRLRGCLMRRLTAFPNEVEDLVQEPLLALHLQHGTYDPKLAVSGGLGGSRIGREGERRKEQHHSAIQSQLSVARQGSSLSSAP